MAEGISRYSVPPSAGPLLPLAVAPVMTAWKDRPLSVLMGDKLRRHRATACRGRGGMLAVELTPRASKVSVHDQHFYQRDRVSVVHTGWAVRVDIANEFYR